MQTKCSEWIDRILIGLFAFLGSALLVAGCKSSPPLPPPPPVQTQLYVQLVWISPTSNIAGEPIDISTFRVYYGANPQELIHSMDVAPNVTKASIGNLTRGSWYFTVTAITPEGESDPSNVAVATVE
jgi:hypothetical protein